MIESKEFQAHINNKAITDEQGRISGPILVRSGRFGFDTPEDEAEQLAKFKAGVLAVASLFGPQESTKPSTEITNLDACDLNVHNVLALKGVTYPYEQAMEEARTISASWHEKTNPALAPITKMIKKELRWDQLFGELEEKTGITKKQLIELVTAYYKLDSDFKRNVEEPIIGRMKHIHSKASKASIQCVANAAEQATLFTDYTLEECAGVLAMRLLGYKTLLYLNRLNNPATTYVTNIKLEQALEKLMQDKEKLTQDKEKLTQDKIILLQAFETVAASKIIIQKIDQNPLGLVEMSFSTIEAKKSSPVLAGSSTTIIPTGSTVNSNGRGGNRPRNSSISNGNSRFSMRASSSNGSPVGSSEDLPSTSSIHSISPPLEPRKYSPPNNSGSKLMTTQYQMYANTNGSGWATMEKQPPEVEVKERKLLLAEAFFSSFKGGESPETLDVRTAAYRRLANEDLVMNDVTDQAGNLSLIVEEESIPEGEGVTRRRMVPGKGVSGSPPPNGTD